MKKYNYMDPSAIMTLVVTLIVLAVGIYAFLITTSSFGGMNPYPRPSATTSTAQNQTWQAWNDAQNNSTTIGLNVINIVGIVIVIGAIMTIVGIVYSYTKPGGY